MSLFSSILDKLGLGKKKETTPAASTASAPSASISGTATSVKPQSTSGPVVVEPDAKITARPATPAPTPISEVDVVKKLETLAAGSGLDWKVSIVDLLKLLGLDSSREARNELAKELGCPEELMSDSAKMNTWLHKTVLRKIAENGGNIPKELLD